MIKFFRKIRLKMLTQNLPAQRSQAGKYLLYAIGEILLVVIGILIALWLNNSNQNYTLNKEQKEMTVSLELELKENIKELGLTKDYLINSRTDFIKVLNFSAGSDTSISVDSLRLYTTRMIAIQAGNLNTSVLNNYKASGKFKLLDEELTTLFTVYETALTNYSRVKEFSNNFLNKETNELMLHFSTLKKYENLQHPDNPIAKHPDFNKSDSEFISYLKSKDIYEFMYRLNSENAVYIA